VHTTAGLGFRNTMSTTDFAACHPQLMPNKKRDEKFSPPPAPAQRVAAVVIVETPEDWFEDLQVLCDVLQTDGRLGCRAAEGRQPVRLIVCNEDFTFAWADVPPRFGPGAFVTCLEALYTRMTGRQLQYDTYGKPHAPAYSFAQRQLALQLFPGADIDSADRAALPDGMTVYAIGDNPTSDIRGANAAGNQWRSILVRTGVFDSEKENDPLDPVWPELTWRDVPLRLLTAALAKTLASLLGADCFCMRPRRTTWWTTFARLLSVSSSWKG
jgi:HAD superfamily hydrolase (TIGR01456 family)